MRVHRPSLLGFWSRFCLKDGIMHRSVGDSIIIHNRWRVQFKNKVSEIDYCHFYSSKIKTYSEKPFHFKKYSTLPKRTRFSNMLSTKYSPLSIFMLYLIVWIIAIRYNFIQAVFFFLLRNNNISNFTFLFL